MTPTCGAWFRGKQPCDKPFEVMHLKTFPLCKTHYLRFLSEMRMCQAKGFWEAQKTIPTIEEVRAAHNTPKVYFIRAGHRVKIGYSINPETRLNSIRAGHCKAPRGLDTSTARILALEPGGREREVELHQQFAHLREAGEWFRRAPELTAYIDQLAA